MKLLYCNSNSGASKMELIIKLPLFSDIPFFYKVKESETLSGVEEPIVEGQEVRTDYMLLRKYKQDINYRNGPHIDFCVIRKRWNLE